MNGNDKKCWLQINKMYTRGKENHGSLLHFIVNNLHWELNYRGDAPLLIFTSNGTKHILQIDGDLFFPEAVDLCDNKDDEQEYDRYLFSMEELLRFINILLYEDLELEYAEDEETEGPDYELDYEGENEEAFNKLEEKIERNERILEEDIVLL